MLFGDFAIINKDFRIVSTNHTLKRMEERRINPRIVKDVVRGLDYYRN